MGQFERKFQAGGKGILASENQIPWAITWRCLRDPTFGRFDTIPACDRHTHTDTKADSQTDRHATTANTRASIASPR